MGSIMSNLKKIKLERILEICCDSVQSAINAQKGGADRIELCENLAQGGVSPSAGKIVLAKRKLNIPIFVLIRPRKGDFFFDELEVECMIENIHQAKALGADGIVSGALLKDGRIDEAATAKLIEASRPLPFTFHRAFDRTPKAFEALDVLIKLGVDRILTSGLAINAKEGFNMIQSLVEKAQGKTEIMACGSVRPDNIDSLVNMPGLKEMHSAARKNVKSPVTFFGNAQMGDEALEAEYTWFEVDEQMVREMKEKMN